MSERHHGPLVQRVAVDEDVGVLVFAPHVGTLTPHPPRAVGHTLGTRIGLVPLDAFVVGLFDKQAAILRHLLTDEQLSQVQISAVLLDVIGIPGLEDAQVGGVYLLATDDRVVTSRRSRPALLVLGAGFAAKGCESEEKKNFVHFYLIIKY